MESYDPAEQIKRPLRRWPTVVIGLFQVLQALLVIVPTILNPRAPILPPGIEIPQWMFVYTFVVAGLNLIAGLTLLIKPRTGISVAIVVWGLQMVSFRQYLARGVPANEFGVNFIPVIFFCWLLYLSNLPDNPKA